MIRRRPAAAAVLAALLMICLAASGCGTVPGSVFAPVTADPGTDSSAPGGTGSVPSIDTSVPGTDEGGGSGGTDRPVPPTDPRHGFSLDFSDRETETSRDLSGAVRIEFSSSSVSVTGRGASASGSAVTVTAAGVYVLSGSCAAGSVTVAAGPGDKVSLVLDGLSLVNPEGPAVFVKSADKVFLTTSAGTSSTLADGPSYKAFDGETELDAAVYSRSDLAFNGSGTLEVRGNLAHGIVSRDDLVVGSGTLRVSSVKTGVSGKDSVRIAGGSLSVEAGSNGIRATNALEPSKGYVYVKGGAVSVRSGKEAFQAETCIRIDGGSVNAEAGGSGLRCGADYLQTGGSVLVCSLSSNGKYPLAYSNSAEVSGGTFAALGSSEAGLGLTACSNQASFAVSFPGQGPGTDFSVTDASGNSVISFHPSRAYSSCTVSAPGLVPGASYTVRCGGSDVLGVTMDAPLVNRLAPN